MYKRIFTKRKWRYYFSLNVDIVLSLNALDALIVANKDVISAVSLLWHADVGDGFYTRPTTVCSDEIGEYRHHYGTSIEEIDAAGGVYMWIIEVVC